jgi:hypothetical protein
MCVVRVVARDSCMHCPTSVPKGILKKHPTSNSLHLVLVITDTMGAYIRNIRYIAAVIGYPIVWRRKTVSRSRFSVYGAASGCKKSMATPTYVVSQPLSL